MRTLYLGLAFLTFLSMPVIADSFTTEQKEEIGTIARDYLLKNPELLRDMIQNLEKSEQQARLEKADKAVAAHASEIYHDRNDVIAGNPQGSLTIVEFFDYNCAWCKKDSAEIIATLEADKDVKLILKEFPIFGPDSEYAAAAAMAAHKQDKYWPFHLAMLKHEGKLDKAGVDKIAKAQGLDLKKLEADLATAEIKDALARNRSLAEALGIEGTPAFLIGEKLYPGYLTRADLASALAALRKSGGCKIC